MRLSTSNSCFTVLVKILLLYWAIFLVNPIQAQKSGSPSFSGLYFPPSGSSDWEKVTIPDLGWNQNLLAELLAWLPTQDTRAFIVLKDGKLVLEEYWGAKLTGTGEMDQNSYWYWESAGKTLTATLIGIAQQEKLLAIKDRTQKYLGEGWTSMPISQEKNIRLIHHLSFSTGINDQVANLDTYSPSSFTYLAKPGTRWSYHNATYSVLEKVLEKASGKEFDSYFKEKIGDRIGMKGLWQKSGQNTMFYSDARSLARFGLLLLARGNWNGNQIWSGPYFDEMIQSSQKLNQSYGYFTWLNGKENYMLPGNQQRISGAFIPSGPTDMYMAVGGNGQLLMVVPSKNLVIVRMGGAPGNLPVPYLLIRQFWDRMSEVIR